MRPAPFDYHAPTSLAHVLELLQTLGPDAKLLAGGQSLLPLMNLRLARPAALIDLAGVPNLGGIAVRDGRVTIGAMVTHAEIEGSSELRERHPLLPAVARFIGHEAIRTRGPLGGSLAHADPLAEWPLVMALVGARIKAAGAGGERWIDAAEFFLGPLATALRPHEVVVEVEVPLLPPFTGWSFQEIARRPGDFALAAVGALVSLDRDGSLARVRVAVGGCGLPNFLAPVDGQGIEGSRPAEGLWRETAEGVSRALAPGDDIHATAEDRRQMARALTRRGLADAAKRARS
jgi:carbon-monoxide dehydrogenase medium subunit